MTDEEIAFHAGWVARSDTHNCEWRDSFPNRPDLGYLKWKGLPLPRPTAKQESFMQKLGIWGDDCRYLTVAQARVTISREVERRNAAKQRARDYEEERDLDDFDYAIADAMCWGFDD